MCMKDSLLRDRLMDGVGRYIQMDLIMLGNGKTPSGMEMGNTSKLMENPCSGENSKKGYSLDEFLKRNVKSKKGKQF